MADLQREKSALIADILGPLEAAVDRAVSSQAHDASNTLQDSYAASSQQNSSTRRIVVGGGAAGALVMSMFAGWAMDFGEKIESAVELAPVTDKKVDDVATKVELLEGRLQAVGRQMLRQEVQHGASIEWLGKKLDAMNRRAKAVKRPDVLNHARDRAAQIAEDRKLEELFAIDPTDAD